MLRFWEEEEGYANINKRLCICNVVQNTQAGKYYLPAQQKMQDDLQKQYLVSR